MPNDTDKGQDAMDFTPEQQKFLDKKIGEARVKAREKAQEDATEAAKTASEAAERAKLEADKQWEQLAAKHETRVKELEPFEAQAKAYLELIEGMLVDKIKELGEDAKRAVKALPESLTVVERLSWLNANEGLFKKTEEKPTGSPKSKVKPAVKPTAKGSGDKADKISDRPLRL